MHRRAALAAALAALPLAGAAAQPRSVSLAITDVPGLEELQRDFGPFREAFQRLSGMELRFFPVNSRTAAVEALNARRVDFVLTGPSEYVVFRQRTNAVPVVTFQRPDYFSNIVVLARSEFQTPADLRGRRVAFGDAGSTSRHLGPMQVLADHGLDPRRDVQPMHVSRNLAIEALRRGDVAAIGVNHTDVQQLRQRFPDLPLRVIARGRDLPDDVMVAGAHVPAATIEAVRRVFVDNSAEMWRALTATESNQKYVGGVFLPTPRDADYNYVRAMYRTIGQPQFADFVGN
ncbi:PhnD/SsuA/transferrin family substrate-binding protein [Rubritepida flocculans]|uniref:PhnD/SsuA/transferrin family substrate-binding protein n=1 Tax=Rubritepida flocculans TaxID=182403 RepID=UPI0004277EFD|nr:PhnD/SsuA/transferrin family substrate-binding protein [Rubritepida flocculans]